MSRSKCKQYSIKGVEVQSRCNLSDILAHQCILPQAQVMRGNDIYSTACHKAICLEYEVLVTTACAVIIMKVVVRQLWGVLLRHHDMYVYSCYDGI